MPSEMYLQHEVLSTQVTLKRSDILIYLVTLGVLSKWCGICKSFVTNVTNMLPKLFMNSLIVPDHVALN